MLDLVLFDEVLLLEGLDSQDLVCFLVFAQDYLPIRPRSDHFQKSKII